MSLLRAALVSAPLLVASLAGAVASSATLGCASASVSSPRGVLRAYADALSEGRADDAYRMLSEEARRGITLEAFRVLVKQNKS